MMYNYWITEGEIVKHKKYGEGIIIKSNNVDECWAFQNLKTNDITILDENDLPNMELVSK